MLGIKELAAILFNASQIRPYQASPHQRVNLRGTSERLT
jgi:hypothetical protein